MSNRNPDNNTVVQALLDLADRGMGNWKVDELITRLNTDPKLRADVQRAWNAHAYPERSIVYTQLGLYQQMYSLSDAAMRIIMLLGMYCHQSGLVQAKLNDMSAAVQVSRSSAKKAITELCDCGALMISVPSAQHSAPIYRVNPALMHKGTRRRSNIAAFETELTIEPQKYILNRRPELLVQTDIVRTETFAYNRLHLAPADDVQTVKKQPSRRKKKAGDEEQLPGQMSLFDFIEREDAAGDE